MDMEFSLSRVTHRRGVVLAGGSFIITAYNYHQTHTIMQMLPMISLVKLYNCDRFIYHVKKELSSGTARQSYQILGYMATT
uniref:Uncharacterized protein n=1 Tax=Triticum urartu TaxID=4572 RepID=A0A8R7TB58_TRIUA